MIAMMKKLGKPGAKKTKMLFLGDYVDRGEYGVEVVCYLMCLKLTHPDDVYLLRGNHESRDMTQMFNFRDQCVTAYDQEVYENIMELFDNLPVACLVNGLYLTMHGGISDQLQKVSTINKLDRFREVDEEGLLADLLWADPAPQRKCNRDYCFNDDRQISVIFGKNPVKSLLKREGLRAIIRGHQMKQKGYKFHQWDGEEEFPPVITVFSAPNYSGSGNDAAVVITDGDSVDLRTFSEKRGKPFVLHDRADAFSVFQPKLQSLVLDMMYNVFKMAQSAKSSAAQRSLGVDSEKDVEYLKRIVEESNHPKKDEVLKKIDTQFEAQKSKDASKAPTNLADLLSGLEDDFGDIDELKEINDTS